MVSLLSYGFELFNFTFGPDDELHFFSRTSLPDIDWIGQGRWGIWVLSCFVPNPSVPFFSLFLTLFFSCISLLLLLDKFEYEDYLSRIMILPLFCGFPLLYYVYSFHSLNPYLGFGFLFASISVVIQRKMSKRWHFLAVIAGSFSIGIYQAFIIPLILFYLFDIIVESFYQNVPHRKTLCSILYKILILTLCITVYYLVNKSLIYALKVNTSYTDGLVVIPSKEEFWICLKAYLSNIYPVYFGSPLFFTERMYIFPILVLFSLAIIILSPIFRKQNLLQYILYILVSMLILLLPGIINLISLGAKGLLPVRAYCLGFAVSLAILVALAWHDSRRFFKIVLIVLSGWAILSFFFVNNKMAYMRFMQNRLDERIAFNVMNRIDMLAIENKVSQPYRVVMVGMPDFIGNKSNFYSRIPYASIGGSFYRWEDGNVHRMTHFFQLLGDKTYERATKEDYKRVLKVCEQMPRYPAQESIKYFDGVFIVKFSEFTNSQRRNYDLFGNFVYLNNIFGIQKSDSLPDNAKCLSIISEKDLRCNTPHLNVYRVNNKLTMKTMGVDPLFYIKKEAFKAIDSSFTHCLHLKFFSEQPDLFQIFVSWPDKSLGIAYWDINQGENDFCIILPNVFWDHDIRLDPGAKPDNIITWEDISIWSF